MPYSAIFKDHLAHPRNVGELPDASVVVEETNPVCGDRVRLHLKVVDDEIAEVRYLAYGCPPTLVCGSVLTEIVTGKSLQEVKAIDKESLIAAVGGLPSRKHHAAALVLEALAAAIQDLTRKSH